MKKIINLAIFCLVILFGSSACNISISVGDRELKDGYHEDYQPPSSTDWNITYAYSQDQLQVLNDYGNPTRFTILFGANERMETWYYDTDGYTAVFLNGTQISDKFSPAAFRDGMYATLSTPDQFTAGMGIDDVVIRTGKHDLVLTTVEGESFTNRLMHIEGLSVGFHEGEINYVETYPAMTEYLLQAEDFLVSPELTPEEAANEGEHEFLVVTYLDDELLDSHNNVFEIEFSRENVCLTEYGSTYCFRRSGENEYIDETGEMKMFMILDGFIWLMEGENGIVETLFSRMSD